MRRQVSARLDKLERRLGDDDDHIIEIWQDPQFFGPLPQRLLDLGIDPRPRKVGYIRGDQPAVFTEWH